MDIRTEAAQREFKEAVDKATAERIAQIRAEREANGGRPVGQSARPWQYVNSNIHGGL